MRIFLVCLAFSFLYGALIAQLYRVQINEGIMYTAKAESQLAYVKNPKITRGNINFSDKDGAVITAALEKNFTEIFAVPSKISNPRETAIKLIDELDLSESVEVLANNLANTNSQYRRIVARASNEQVEVIKELDLDGIYMQLEPYRYYPFQDLASHLLGFFGFDEGQKEPRGLYGVENYFDNRLSGSQSSGFMGWMARKQSGEDVRLTVDFNIQSQAEDVLRRMVDRFEARGGSVIVNDPKTGKILAIASSPRFNPNNYGDFPVANFLNPVVQGRYEPGSIFKVLTMAAAFDSGAVTANTVYTDKGYLTLNGRTIRNWDLKAHGRQTMTEVIEKSLNTGTVFAVQEMGNEEFLKYLDRMDLNSLTGISLPGEVPGSMGELENNPRDINFATASYGQGISVTPIGLLKSVSALANEGLMMRPIIDAQEIPQPMGRLFSERVAREMMDIMVSSVDKNLVAVIPGYSVAGKTGTAQVAYEQKRGYSDEVVNTYVGFAPASNPKFSILVKLDEPKGAPLAGQTVVPAFKELAEFILNYYNVPPDRI